MQFLSYRVILGCHPGLDGGKYRSRVQHTIIMQCRVLAWFYTRLPALGVTTTARRQVLRRTTTGCSYRSLLLPDKD